MLKNPFFTVVGLCSGVVFTSCAWATQTSGAAVIGGAPANSIFTNIRSTDAGVSPETIFDARQVLNNTVNITVDPTHVGKPAAIYVVAKYQNQWFLKNSANVWQAWDGDIKHLQFNYTLAALKPSESIVVEQQLSQLPGKFDVYVGYQLDNSYTFNATPFAFSVVTAKLNDTGVYYCANATQYLNGNLKDSFNNALPFTCPIAEFPAQDAEHGRDATNNDNSDGVAGFSFSKVSRTGEKLPLNAANWGCVKDNVTGLLWENKTPSINSNSDALSQLHSQDNIYSWYNPNIQNNGGGQGIINGGSCAGSQCDTDAFVKKVNETGWCGFNDGWRLPTKQELLSIVDNTRYAGKLMTSTDLITGITSSAQAVAAIDPNFFPNTPALDFWTSSPFANGTNDAWSVYFYYGSISYNSNKNNLFRVRLVRG